MGARQPMGSQKLIEVSKTASNKDEWNILTSAELNQVSLSISN